MADTELKIRVSAQMADAKAALEALTKQLSQIAQGSAQLGAAATAGFDRMEAAAERAAKASLEVAAAATRMGDALDKANQKASKPLPTPKVPTAPLSQGVADQAAVQRAAYKVQLADLEASHKAGLTETRAYHEQRAAIQRAALTAEIAAAKAAHDAATSQQARNAAASRQAILQTQLDAIKVMKAPTAALTTGVVDQNAVERAALKQKLVDLEASHKAGLTETKAYYQQRAAIQRAALQAEIAQAKAAHAAATTQTARNAAASRQAVLQTRLAGVSDAVPKTEQQVGGLATILGQAKSAAVSLGLAIGTIGAIKAFVGMADQAKMLEGRLRLVTSSSEEYAVAQAKLFDIAQRTRSDVASVIDLYSRFSTSTKELGVSQGELLRVTETVSKAIKLSFSSGESANAALIQLGQGLAAGTLRGQELQSVLEQAPRLAQAVAAGMGVAVGKLKEMGEQGKITAAQVLDALSTQAGKIDQEFTQLPLDVSGAMTVLTNSLTKASGEFDRVTGITGGLSKAIAGLGPVVESVANSITEKLAAASASWGTSFAQLDQAIDASGKKMEESWFVKADRSIADGIAAFFGFIEDSFVNFSANMIALIQPEFVKLIGNVDKLIVTAGLLKNVVAAIFTDDTVRGAWEQYNAEWQRAQATMEKGLREIEDNLLRSVQAGENAVKKIREQREKNKQTAEQKVAVEPRKPEQYGPPAPPPGVDAREVERDALRQRLDILKASYDLALIATADYYKRRLSIQRQMLAIEIEQEKLQASKATSPDAKAKSLTNVAVLEGKRAELARQSAAELLSAERDLQDKLGELRVQALTAEGKVAEARSAELEQQYRELRARFRVEGSAEGVGLIDKLIGYEMGKAHLEELAELTSLRVKQLESEGDLLGARNLEIEAGYQELIEKFTRAGNQDGLALVERLIGYDKGKAALDQLGADIDKTIADFRAAEESAANSVLTGTSEKTAAEQTRIAAEKSLPTLEAQREKLAKLALTSRDAAVKLRDVDAAMADLNRKSLSGVGRALAELRIELDGLKTSFATDYAFALRDNLNTLFQDIITGSKKAGEALRDFAKNFAKAILQMITQILATQAAKAILSRGGGLLGIIGTGLGAVSGGSTTAPVKHAGGVVGMGGGPLRSVPLAAFYGAPKLHTGGSLGLYADEVPTILQRGEEVLSKQDPRNVRNQGAGNGGGPILVQLHPDHNHRTMRDWLEGELARVAATS